MKLNKNQSGIAHLAVVLVVVLLAVIGYGGWRVYSENMKIKLAPARSQPEAKNEAAKNPENFKEFESKEQSFKLSYPKEWGEAKELDISKTDSGPKELNLKTPILYLGFDKLKEFDTLTVWNQNDAHVNYSFNAPAYCVFNVESKKWDPRSIGVEAQCNQSKRNSGGLTAYQFTKNALGAYGFQEVLDIRGKTVLFSSFAESADFTNTDQGPSLKDGVKERVDSFVVRSVDQLIKANK